MRKHPVVSALTVLIAGATPAGACQWEHAPEPIGGPSAVFLMPKMAAAASFVDLVVAEGAHEHALPPGEQHRFSQALSFRVLQRLRGNSPDRFLLFGSLGEAKPGGDWGMTHWVDRQGRIFPHRGVLEGAPSRIESMTSCDPPTLSVAVGRTYLVFREADGRLLKAVQFHEGDRTHATTPMALADKLGVEPDDIVRQSWQALAPDVPHPALPAATPEPESATLVFRRPLGLAQAKALLAGTSSLPFGAILTRNGVTSDYRLGSDFAFTRLLDDAHAWATTAATPAGMLKALAGGIVARADAASFADYDPSLGFVPFLLVEAARRETGPAAFVAIDIKADVATQARLARHPSVLRLEPGRRVRGVVASGTLAPPNPAIPVRASWFDRLTRLAGVTLDPTAVTGEWNIAGTFEARFTAPFVRMRLTNGIAEASGSCFAVTRGTYTLEGLVLKLRLPDADRSKCPKTIDFWSLDYLLGDKDFTVRSEGPSLRLKGASGSDFLLRRAAD